MRVALLLSCVLAAPALPAQADSVHLKGGRVLEGAATLEGDKVQVQLEGGRVSVARSEVERIERATPPMQVAEERERALAKDDLPGLLALANYCREHDLRGKEQTLLTRALALDPEHVEVRRRLGYVRTAEGWVNAEVIARRAERDRTQRALDELELRKRRAELELEQEKLRGKRTRSAESGSNVQTAQAAEDGRPHFPYYAPPYGVLTTPHVVQHWGRPPPYYVAPPTIAPAPASGHNFVINGVREPSSYFEGAFRR